MHKKADVSTPDRLDQAYVVVDVKDKVPRICGGPVALGLGLPVFRNGHRRTAITNIY